MNSLFSQISTSRALSPLTRTARSLLVRTGLLERKYERDFTRIFESGYRGGRESVSGGGPLILCPITFR